MAAQKNFKKAVYWLFALFILGLGNFTVTTDLGYFVAIENASPGMLVSFLSSAIGTCTYRLFKFFVLEARKNNQDINLVDELIEFAVHLTLSILLSWIFYQFILDVKSDFSLWKKSLFVTIGINYVKFYQRISKGLNSFIKSFFEDK